MYEESVPPLTPIIQSYRLPRPTRLIFSTISDHFFSPAELPVEYSDDNLSI